MTICAVIPELTMWSHMKIMKRNGVCFLQPGLKKKKDHDIDQYTLKK